MTETLTKLSLFFPWGLVIALVLAIVFAVLGVLLFREATKKEKAPLPEPSEEKNPYLRKFNEYIDRFGYFSHNPLSKSFSQALSLMHSFIGGTQFRYQLPWVAMLGATDAGKSTLLGNLDLDRPLGRPQFDIENGEPPCDWWFYDHGIVLDLEGKLVIDANQATSDEGLWKLFLNLLCQSRPKRPVDAIVLTIPATELVGASALSHDDIMIRAEYLYGKLWQMQRLTGLTLPIYIVVTKSDAIPGFKSFCHSIPYQNRHDIFGWSNNYAIDSVYETTWIDEAFSTLNTELYRVQQEIYTDAPTIDGRDGIFLFPLALNQIKGRIRTYMDHVFKASSFHESFFLRGIYFVGDSELQRPAPVKGKSQILPLTHTDREEEGRNLFFIENLFEKKIFREVGLARPISRLLLGNTTSLRFAKVAVAVAAIIGTLGLLRANDTLQQSRVNLIPALNEIQTTLHKTESTDAKTEIGRVAFDNQAKTLLNTLTQINVNHLSSYFIPPSWFSQVDSKVGYIVELAYDKIILRSMLNQLNYKARELVSIDSVIPVTETVGRGINPLTTAEFYRLRNYIVSLKALELTANKFNSLGEFSSLRDVAEIIKYLFNYELPEEFYKHDSYYLSALKHSSARNFDFSGYQNSAVVKLHKLFDDFQLAVFDPTQIVPGLAQLEGDLFQFSGARNYTAYDDQLLRSIYQNLNTVLSAISNPAFQWIDLNYFNPGPEYEYVMGLVVDSAFFPKNATVSLVGNADKNLMKFRKELATYSTPLIKGGNLFESEGGLAISTPTQGAAQLNKDLSAFFNETFMAAAEHRQLITNVPIGSVLLWDVLRLQDALALVTDYNKFLNSRLLGLPKALQPVLQKVGLTNLTVNIIQYLADAEIFSTNLQSASAFSPEDALLSQVQNYRAAAPYLEQLLMTLRNNNANAAFGSLKTLLTKQAYLPLEALDAILSEEEPYAIKGDSFSWWTGTDEAALEAYGVSSVGQLKNYLDLQRSRINYLAQEFAEPLTSFLEKINSEGMPGNLPLVTKWEGIIHSLSGYGKKLPGNSLVELETFIIKPLNAVTVETCSKYVSPSEASVSEGYFASILANLQEMLKTQCIALSGHASVTSYAKLADFFNTNLAGSYPFVECGNTKAPDAAPENLKTFFEMMDAQQGGIKGLLKEATDLGPAGAEALEFVKQMNTVREFFGGYLASDSVIPNPAFSYKVDFRVNRDKEVRGNEVVKWEVTSQDSSIDMRSQTKKGFWSSPSSMSTTFRWAVNSPLQPIADGAPHYSVSGENAVFSYKGPWALIKMVSEHKASAGDFASLNDDTPITLRFDIPLNHKSLNMRPGSDKPTATVFIRVTLAPIVKKEKPKAATAKDEKEKEAAKKPKITAGKPVAIPYFPTRAPQLHPGS